MFGVKAVRLTAGVVQQQVQKDEGNPLRIDNRREVDFADLVLVEVWHVSRASLQPIFGLLSRV